MLTFQLEALTVEELRSKAIISLGITKLDLPFEAAPPKPVAAPSEPVVADKPKRGRPPKKASGKAPVAEFTPVQGMVAVEEEEIEEEDEKIEEEEEFDPEGDRMHPAPEEQDPDDVFAQQEQSDISALLKLKKDTIDILQDAFAQGKVVKLRKLLMTYGDGAKSFPEVDPLKFTDIDKALKAGALS